MDLNHDGHPRGFGICIFIEFTRTFFAIHMHAGIKLLLSCTIYVCVQAAGHLSNMVMQIILLS